MLFDGMPKVEVSNFSSSLQTTRANEVTQNLSQIQLTSPDDKQEEPCSSQSHIQKIIEFEESVDNGQPPSFAQSQILSQPPKPISKPDWFTEVCEAEATFRLSAPFGRDYDQARTTELFQ